MELSPVTNPDVPNSEKPAMVELSSHDVCVHSTMRSSSENGFINFYIRDAISTFDSEIRKACERMVEVEGGIWGHLATVDQIEGLLQ